MFILSLIIVTNYVYVKRFEKIAFFGRYKHISLQEIKDLELFVRLYARSHSDKLIIL